MMQWSFMLVNLILLLRECGIISWAASKDTPSWDGLSGLTELMSSKSLQFSDVGNELNASERMLIQQYSPCFNVSLNSQPTPVPDSYLPANAPFRRRRSLTTLIHEAERAVKAEDTELWLEDMK
jgi:hypothetical protein